MAQHRASPPICDRAQAPPSLQASAWDAGPTGREEPSPGDDSLQRNRNSASGWGGRRRSRVLSLILWSRSKAAAARRGAARDEEEVVCFPPAHRDPGCACARGLPATGVRLNATSRPRAPSRFCLRDVESQKPAALDSSSGTRPGALTPRGPASQGGPRSPPEWGPPLCPPG